MSPSILKRLEELPEFRQAHTVLLYHSLKDEVQTHDFVEKWSKSKCVLLPVVVGERLELRRYNGRDALATGRYGIAEPAGAPFTDYPAIELAVIPGVAFDRRGHRLGRGKGYYDRLLPKLASTKRIGICFPFQIVEHVPTETSDIDMNLIITSNENELPHPYHPLPTCNRER